MAPILYYTEFSPPVRGVLLTAKAIGLKFELRSVNLMEKEHLKPEYVKMNPQHTVPTLDDNGFILWDSHAIAVYLVGKYAKDDSLYPKDLQKRATVDQRLHFNSSTLSPRVRSVVFPTAVLKQKPISAETQNSLREAYELVDKFLEGRTYLAGNQLTIADLCVVASLSTVVPIVPPPQNLTNFTRWFNSMKQLPYYQEANGKGADMVVNLMKSVLA